MAGCPCAKVPAGPQRAHVHAHHIPATPLQAPKALPTGPVRLQRLGLFPQPVHSLPPNPGTARRRGEKTARGESSDVGPGWTSGPGHKAP